MFKTIRNKIDMLVGIIFLRTDLGTHQIHYIFLCSKSGQDSHEYCEDNFGLHLKVFWRSCCLNSDISFRVCLGEAVTEYTTCLSVGGGICVFHKDCTFSLNNLWYVDVHPTPWHPLREGQSSMPREPPLSVSDLRLHMPPSTTLLWSSAS